jgi:hypothetical protein
LSGVRGNRLATQVITSFEKNGGVIHFYASKTHRLFYIKVR